MTMTTAEGESPAPPGLLTLPPEIREHVYSLILRSANNRYQPEDEDQGPFYTYDLSILRVNRLIHHEASKIFNDNIFVKITTPWTEAIPHVNSEGKVAVVTTGRPATDFQSFHLRVLIDTPDLAQWRQPPPDSYSMITTLEDLPAFTRIWYFSNLNNNRQLNPHLQLRLDLKNPYNPDAPVTKSLQTKLLMPFGQVKDLESTQFEYCGHSFFPNCPVYPSIRTAVLEEQAKPAPTPEECIEQTLVHKKAGNELFAKKAYTEALQIYFKAFESMHIYISGRKREIHCDGYYGEELRSGTHKGQYAHYVRMTLRVQLVANVVYTYLQLEEWAEAFFWGKRSIRLFRASMEGTDQIGGNGWDNWVRQSVGMTFAAKKEMGKLFYRTALAGRQLVPQSKSDYSWEGTGREELDALMRAAEAYLPDDLIVQGEVKAMELRNLVRSSGS